ncbi:MAG: polysaccharide pyruvyl transferase family protein [Acutalibacteraceae bacterium]|nr:polysaccharide pyruvyl transferase family protein [Acutalibacteraceae bacterium]
MIGLCINYYNKNFGGLLQAYATVKKFEEMGVKCEIIRYKKKYTPLYIIKSIPRVLNGVLIREKKESFTKKIFLLIVKGFAENERVRKHAFEEFLSEKFINLSTIHVGYDKLCDGSEKYCAVVTCSDQLWSPSGLPTNFYNLMFVPDNIRKISYASSFGVGQIPWYQKKRTADFLKRIDYISMRERRGSQIVKELINREVPTILDPVFMFDKQGWEKLIPTERVIDEPYIFAYFLGKNSEHRKAVEKFAKQIGYKIVTLRHLDQYIPEDESFGDFAPYDVGPDKFLNILRGADYVCTDSFHGACFSIINKKNFVVFNRYSDSSRASKNSRIDTLCNTFDLDERRYDSSENLLKKITEKICYDVVEEKLKILKKEANLYLESALEGVQ